MVNGRDHPDQDDARRYGYAHRVGGHELGPSMLTELAGGHRREENPPAALTQVSTGSP